MLRNYAFVQPTAELLEEALYRQPMPSRSELERVFGLLRSPLVNPQESTAIAVATIKSLASQRLELSQSVEAATDLLVRSMAAGRPLPFFARTVARRAEVDLLLLPGALDSVRRTCASLSTALTETAASQKDRDRFESYLQHLIEAVQKKKGPLATAIGAMQRAGTTWLRAGDPEVAGGVFATAIILVAVESAGAGEEEFATAIGRAVLIPFLAAADADKESTDLERHVRAELRRHLGKSARMIEDLFPMARERSPSAFPADCAPFRNGSFIVGSPPAPAP